MSASKRTRSDSEMEMSESSPPTKKRILFESSSNAQKSLLDCSESMEISCSNSNDENKGDSSNIVVKEENKENKENLKKITTLLSTQKTLCDDILENMLDMESLHRSYTPEAKFLKYVTLPLNFFKNLQHHSRTQVQKGYRGVVDRYL